MSSSSTPVFSSSSSSVLPPPATVSGETTSTAATVSSSVKRLSGHISGFVNYTPKQQYAFNKWVSTIKSTFEQFGFNYLHTRPFERKAALWGEGETQKQIFGVTRLSIEEGEDPDTGLAIPYDRTVPFALWTAEHAHEIPFPYKRQDVSLSHRGERAMPGRFRAFVQADVDVVGRKLGLEADVECLATLMTGLNRLNLGTPYTLIINHIGIVKAMVRANGIAKKHQAEVFRLVDKLDKLSQEEVVDMIADIENLGAARSDIAAMVKKFAERSSLDSYEFDKDYGVEAAQGLKDLKTMMELLRSMDVDTSCIQFAPGMVRGLDYYTGVVFEAVLVGKEKYGSISAGGRYDDLVGSYNPKYADVGGVGGTIGLTRLFDIALREKMPLPERTTIADVLVGYRTEEQRTYAYRIAAALRKQSISTDVSCSQDGGVKGFYTYADKTGVPLSVCVMDTKSIVVKDMHRFPDESPEARSYRGEDVDSVVAAVGKTTKLLQLI